MKVEHSPIQKFLIFSFKALLLSLMMLCVKGVLMRLLWLKCHGCSASQHFCNGCDNIIHGYLPFHDRDAIVSGHYVPIPATTSRNSKGEWLIVGRSLPLRDVLCTSCNSKCKPLEILPDSHCIIVTLRGANN